MSALGQVLRSSRVVGNEVLLSARRVVERDATQMNGEDDSVRPRLRSSRRTVQEPRDAHESRSMVPTSQPFGTSHSLPSVLTLHPSAGYPNPLPQAREEQVQDDFSVDADETDDLSVARPSQNSIWRVPPYVGDDEEDRVRQYLQEGRAVDGEGDRPMTRLNSLSRHIAPQSYSSPSSSLSGRRRSYSTTTLPITAVAAGFPSEIYETENVIASAAVRYVEEVSEPVVAAVVEENGLHGAIPDRGPYAPTMEGAGVPPPTEKSFLFYTLLVLPAIAVLTIVAVQRPSWKTISSGISALFKIF